MPRTISGSYSSGIALSKQRAIDAIPAGANVIVTLDCDGLDPTVIPGVIGRAPGGLTSWQTVELLHGAAKRARIAAFDLVEFVPERDVNELARWRRRDWW